MPPVYKYNGTEITYAGTEYAGYQEDKCCGLYVWKGPAYFTE